MTGIRQQYTAKDLGIDLLCDIAGAFLFNIGIYNFAVNAEFAPVGVSGIALILRYLFGLPMGIVSILLNIPILLVSYKLLGRSPWWWMPSSSSRAASCSVIWTR